MSIREESRDLIAARKEVQSVIEASEAMPADVTAASIMLVLLASPWLEGERARARTEQGSCWDEAPSLMPLPGECQYPPARCNLPAGHDGAHRSGRTEWMRRGPEPERLAEGVEHARNFLCRRFYMHHMHVEALDEEIARLRRNSMRALRTDHTIRGEGG